MKRTGLLAALAYVALSTGAWAEAIDAHWSLELDGVSDFEVAISLQQQSPDSISSVRRIRNSRNQRGSPARKDPGKPCR